MGESRGVGFYTEEIVVQQTTANYLVQRLGWESVDAHTRNDFGVGGLLGRTSEREVVLTSLLREKLAALNPGLAPEAYDDAVRRIAATVASRTIVAANREKYDLLRDGVHVTYRDEKGKPTKRRLRVFDFDEPANNHFLCVREPWVRGDLYRRRPDIIGFVNGLPLLFIECKNIHRDLKAAFEKNYADYRDTVPHLFHHNAVVMFGNGEKARIGSITSRWGHFHEWKRLAEWIPRRAIRSATMSSSSATRRTARSTARSPSTCATRWGAALLRRRPNQSLRQRGRRQLDPSRRGEGAAEGTGGRWYLCRQRRLGVFRWYSRAWWRVSVRINAPAARGGLRTVATAAKCHRAPVDYHPVAGQMPTGLQ